MLIFILTFIIIGWSINKEKIEKKFFLLCINVILEAYVLRHCLIDILSEFEISWSFEPWDLGTPGPWNPWTSSLLQHLLILPLTSSYLLLSLPPTLLLWYGLVMGCRGGWVVTLENEIGDGPLTFILILKSCGVGGWNPGTSSFFLHSIPLFLSICHFVQECHVRQDQEEYPCTGSYQET